MKKIYLTTLLLIGLIASSNAQQSYWTINWDISKGTGDTGDYIDKVSFSGLSFDGRYFVNEQLTIGGFFAWYGTNDKLKNEPPFEFHQDGTTGHISGTQVRYLNIFPVLITSHYYIESGSSFRPYIGLGLGSVYTEQRTEFGLNSFLSDSWAFGAQPELGAFIPFNSYSGAGINVALRYLYGSSAGELDSLSMFSFAIGFGFMN